MSQFRFHSNIPGVVAIQHIDTRATIMTFDLVAADALDERGSVLLAAAQFMDRLNHVVTPPPAAPCPPTAVVGAATRGAIQLAGAGVIGLLVGLAAQAVG